MMHQPNVGSMLGHRLRRRPTLKQHWIDASYLQETDATLN